MINYLKQKKKQKKKRKIKSKILFIFYNLIIKEILFNTLKYFNISFNSKSI